MAQVNKGFGKVMDAQVKELVENAEVHKDTHHISFKQPTLPKGITVDSLETHVNYINQTGLAVEAATTQISHDLFAETKHEHWDGRLELFSGLTFNADSHLREVVGEETLFGGSQLFVDHPHSQEMVDWYSNFSTVNAERAKKLFD